MMKKLLKTRISILLAILLLPVCANATIIDFNDHETGTIQTGDYYDYVYVWDNANVFISGGEIGWFLSAHNSSYINMTGGLSTTLDAFDNSVIEMTDGTIRGANIDNSSIMYLSGGHVFDAIFSIHDNAILHVYGKDFLYTPGGGYGFGWLSGRWADDSEFKILFRYLPEAFPPSSSVILHIVPEPCTIGLIGFGLLLMKRTIKNIRS
jgi:hypothetical protein